MKSRLRSVSVWARITRAPHDQPSALSTIAVGRSPLPGRYPSRTIKSGRAGRTTNTFISSDSPSSAMPPRKPAVTPVATARKVAIDAVSTPSTIEERSPTSNCESTSWPVEVVPSRCAAVGPTAPSALGLVALGS
jgi:hypothetical protein